MKDDCKIERSDELILQCFGFGWWYLMNKIVDFMDTIFMILRKKNHQVTFLHVYHHAIMVVLSWVSMKYMGGKFDVYVRMKWNMQHIMKLLFYSKGRIWNCYSTQCGSPRTYVFLLFHCRSGTTISDVSTVENIYNQNSNRTIFRGSTLPACNCCQRLSGA